MPDLSAFTSLELLELTSEPSTSERIYSALVASLNSGTENFALDGHTGAKLYALAMSLGRVQQASLRLDENRDPSTIYELLSTREAEHSLNVLPRASINERRAALSVAMRTEAPGTWGNISQALIDLLGDDFELYRPTRASTKPMENEVVFFPPDPNNGPSNWQSPDVPRVLGRLSSNISTGLGSTPQTVTYSALDGQTPTLRLKPGMSVIVEPELDGSTERVVVKAASSSGSATFSAAFTKAHQQGALLTTMPWPYWGSSKFFSFIVLSPSASLSPEMQRKVNALMERMATGVSTWAIVLSHGPLTLDDPTLGRLDITPLGKI